MDPGRSTSYGVSDGVIDEKDRADGCYDPSEKFRRESDVEKRVEQAERPTNVPPPWPFDLAAHGFSFDASRPL